MRVLKWRTLGPRGVFLGSTESNNILSVFFRPTGITFEGREANIQVLSDKAARNVAKIRFAVVPCTTGEGAGGFEIHAFSASINRTPSRLELISEWVDPGEPIGSVGWVPMELTHLLKDYLFNRPSYITHYTYPIEDYHLYPSLYVGLSILNLPSLDPNQDWTQTLIRQYALTYKRTNLQRWSSLTSMKPAWNILSGDTL